MKNKEFEQLIIDIQKFMWLDNWEIRAVLKEIESPDIWKGQVVTWEIVRIDYTYFRAYINFDTSILEDEDEEIIHLICHEFSHIYTSNTIEPYVEEREFISHYIWESAFVELKNKFNVYNEQQTEFLARRFKDMYINSKTPNSCNTTKQ